MQVDFHRQSRIHEPSSQDLTVTVVNYKDDPLEYTYSSNYLANLKSIKFTIEIMKDFQLEGNIKEVKKWVNRGNKSLIVQGTDGSLSLFANQNFGRRTVS